MNRMDDLLRWLRVQLDIDEALAREAPHGPWQISNAVDPTKPCQVRTFPDLRLVADGLNWLVAEQIAAHNPTRVLSEVSGKRQALAHYERLRQHTASGDEAYVLAEGAVARQIQYMALAYEHRHGYREEWRP